MTPAGVNGKKSGTGIQVVSVGPWCQWAGARKGPAGEKGREWCG